MGEPLNRREELDRRMHFLERRLKQAQRQWGLIGQGDRLLLGLSGGKDSTTLLHLLLRWSRNAAEKFELAAAHAQVRGADGNAERRELLEAQIDPLGVELFFVDMEPASARLKPSGRHTSMCFRCAWNRRRELFRLAGQRGFNKVAFAHHLDDAVQTTLMNLLFHGNLETMEPRVELFDGKITLVRPLILATEREIERVGTLLDTPFLACSCPPGIDTERDTARRFISSFGRRSRAVKSNLWRASRRWAAAGLIGERE